MVPISFFLISSSIFLLKISSIDNYFIVLEPSENVLFRRLTIKIGHTVEFYVLRQFFKVFRATQYKKFNEFWYCDLMLSTWKLTVSAFFYLTYMWQLSFPYMDSSFRN